MLPSTQELQYFIEVAEILNISRAAERLGVTQPTLSVAIQRLEHSLGTPLLIRSKSGVKLTKTGENFKVHARSLLEQWKGLRKQILETKDEVRGHFTIGCHPSVALYSLPQSLPKLLKEHADLEISLVHNLSRKVNEAVISFRVDFGIIVNPVAHPDLVIKELCLDEVTYWYNPAHNNTDTLVYNPDMTQAQTLLSKSGKKRAQFRRFLTSTDLEAKAALAAAGAGVAILPTRVAQREAPGSLVRLWPKGPHVTDHVALVYRRDLQKGIAAKTIIDALIKGFS